MIGGLWTWQVVGCIRPRHGACLLADARKDASHHLNPALSQEAWLGPVGLPMDSLTNAWLLVLLV